MKISTDRRGALMLSVGFAASGLAQANVASEQPARPVADTWRDAAAARLQDAPDDSR
jgi:hypothetical protein